jgi:cytochrome c oxidase subunit 1
MATATATIAIPHRTETQGARYAVLAYLVTCGVVLLLMMLFGLTMRLAQSGWITLDPALFYVLLTMHGAGMVGIAGVGGAAIMWYFVRRYVPVSTTVFVVNLGFFLLGAVLILGSGFIGGFAGAWTFLYPLPAHSNGVWPDSASAAYFLGLISIGVGFLLLHLDVARAIMSAYGNLANALGIKVVLGISPAENGPPPAVTAATMASIVNICGVLVGAIILILSLVNLYDPAFQIDALVAKNMIYFFGHVFINATIYMAVIAVYEILPIYAGRAYKTSKLFYLSWIGSTVMVLIVFPHHLFMDFAMPTWALIIAQIISWLAGLPVLLVTAFGALTLVHRSGIRWDAASGLLFLGVLGWASGVIPAIADGTIAINSVMHNTQWVPGHFHIYLLLGMIAMLLGFITYLSKGPLDRPLSNGTKWGFWIYVAGGVCFVLAFLAGGSASVPRRYAEHLVPWQSYDKVGAIGAIGIVLGVGTLIVLFLVRLPTASRGKFGPAE